MKKTLIFVLALSVLIICFAGCSGSKKEIDTNALEKELVDSGLFFDKMSSVSGDMASGLFGIDESLLESSLLYFSTTATPEELAIFTAKDDASTKKIVEAVENRIENQKRSYASYAAEEVPKLENAVVKTHGRYVIYIVADKIDDADKIIDSYLK